MNVCNNAHTFVHTHAHTHTHTIKKTGEADRENNVLKRAPHTADMLTDAWERPYSRSRAVFPLKYLRNNKYWPTVGRIDNVFGDRHIVCALEN